MLAAGGEAQARVLGDARRVLAHLATVRAAMMRALTVDLAAAPLLSNSRAVIDYLFASMAHEPAEQVRILFLGAKNRLLRDEVISRGTVDQAALHPRVVIKRALELGATSLIIAHNHPSGDPTPSRQDIEVTRKVVAGGAPLDISVHDHVVIAKTGWTSFRALGLLT